MKAFRSRTAPLGVWLFTSLCVLLGAQSCKKEIYLRSSEVSDPKLEKRNDSLATISKAKVETIDFQKFKAEVDFSKLGTLKTSFAAFDIKSNKSRVMSVNVKETYAGFQIQTDSITVFKGKDHVSYIFPVRLSSARAVTFQNLTIDISRSGTLAIVSTYTPTKEWINEWRAGNPGKFKGEMSFTYLRTGVEPFVFSKSGQTSKDKTMLVPNSTMQLQMECVTTTVYSIEFYRCSSNQHDYGDNTCDAFQEGSSVTKAGYNVYSEDVTTCDVWDDEWGMPPSTAAPTSGGGSTSPTPPGGYNPCNGGGSNPSVAVKSGAVGAKLMVHENPECNPQNPNLPPPSAIDPSEPIVLPSDWEMIYPQSWFDDEDAMEEVSLLMIQQGLYQTEPVPESYYKNGQRIDMSNASPRNGYTKKGFSRNHIYFWKELFKLKPEWFDESNRVRINNNLAPEINDTWIAHNPTHRAYKHGLLVHHHENQGRYAYAIPQKVHQKWTKVLHDYKLRGKISGLAGRINGFANFMQVFSSLVDVGTNNPNAWVNWFGSHDKTGVLYKDYNNGYYFEITNQIKYRDSNGNVTRAVVTYDAFDDFIWDADEQKYMGVGKIGKFTEDINVSSHTSTMLFKQTY